MPKIETIKVSATDDAWEEVVNPAGHACREPAVSVIISLYNYSAYITGCLDSVRASKTEGLAGGFEVVVVDDASTDDSARVVEEYLKAHSMPVTLIKKYANTGVSDARNLGLLMARAPLVFILDADNEIRPECLVAHHRAINISGCAMVYGHINCFDDKTRRSVGLTSCRPWNERELVQRPYIDAMAMFRKEALLQLGGYATEYGRILPLGWEDYDLWLKLAQAGYTGWMISEVLSDYRVHAGSQVQKVLPYQFELAHYFSRKFHVLVRRHEDLTTWFGCPREKLMIAFAQMSWARNLEQARAARWLNRWLGPKMCRSICKRLAAAYMWLYPRNPTGKN